MKALALASLGVFKPLKLDVGAEVIKAQLQEERALRVAAVNLLAQDAQEDAETATKISSLETRVADLQGKLATTQADLARVQGENVTNSAALSAALAKIEGLQEDTNEESRLRAQAEAFHTAGMSSLDEANKATETWRQAYLEAEARCTALVKEIRRPLAAAPAVPYELELVRAGPGGDLHKLKLVPQNQT